MNKNYNLKLDLQFRCNNSIMKFNQFDNNTSVFFMRITNGGNLVDIEKALVVLAAIKPSGEVSSQFVEVENGLVYADLKPNMKDEIGTYTAKAMLILEGKKVVTGPISYEVTEDKIFSLLNDTVETAEEFAILTDMLSRLSTIEISEEQRQINEAERILAEENRKIEEAKRVEAELIRQHEEADRTKYDAIRESNENIRKQNESTRLVNEINRIDEEAKRVEEENKRKLAEEERNANYNFMTEDEERRRSEANSHKEAEALRVQAETNRVNEESKRRTTEQARVSAENTRVSNENSREANEVARKNNEAQRVEAETQRKNRYNSFISDAENVANNFENYTNNAKVKEEERKSNELDRQTQEAKRVANEVERISNENTRKASEIVREKNEATRQNTFTSKVNEVDKKIVEIDTTKKDITDTVDNKVKEIENRFNALTSSQQQDSEVIDARTDFKGEVFGSLKERIDYSDKLLRDSTVSTVETESDFTTVEATSNGYFEDVKLEGKTLVNHISNFNNWSNLGRTTISSDGSTVTIDANRWNCGVELRKEFSEGEYYFNIDNKNNATVMIKDTDSGTTFYNGSISNIKINITLPTKANLHFVIKNSDEIALYEVSNPLFVTNKSQETYFEGLASVGQDVDEIVVSSVNENLFNGVVKKQLVDIAGEIIVNEKGRSTDFIKVPSNCALKVNIKQLNQDRVGIVEYDKDKKFIKFNHADSLTSSGSYEFKTDVNTKYIIYYYNSSNQVADEDIPNHIMVNVGTTPKEYTPYQSDKKRLLYYNEETQTWEKPILREWDSIEKHADGKYYYHKRSEEVTYTEGDESLDNCITDLTVSVKKLAEEKVYECTNIDLITYANETNYIVNCGAITPKSTLKVHNNISNVVSLLQKKVSLLESNITSYMITQNRLMLASRYNADTVSFKVDVASLRNSFEYDNDLYELILNNILVGKYNYNREYIENLIIFYWMDFVISDEMHSTLFEIIEEQHNPKVSEEQEQTPLI